jgi:hypothetical protein
VGSSVKEPLGVFDGPPGEDEHAGSSMGGAHLGCSKAHPLRVVPAAGQVGLDLSESSPVQLSNVFQQHEIGS